MQINSTQLAGLLAFLPAALAAAAAFGGAGRGRRGGRGTWAAIALIYAFLAVEILVGLRHRLNLAAGSLLRIEGVYLERRPAQVVMLAVALVLALLVLRIVLRRAATRRQAIASGATAAVLALFVVESISLHAVDAILYRQAGPILLIAWFWLAGGWTVVGAALGRR